MGICTAPTTITGHLRFAAVEQLEGLADNTRRSYLGAIQRLARCDISSLGDLVDDRLSAAIRSLTSDGYAAGTISVTIAAARWVARTLNEADPYGPLSQAAQRVADRQASPQQSAVPLVWDKADCAAQIAAADGTLAGLRDAAIIAVMSDAMLRRSETAALLWSDLDIDEDGSATLAVRRSKTDQTGNGSRQYLGAATVKRIVVWAEACGNEQPPVQTAALFCQVRRGDHVDLGTALSGGAVSQIVTRRAAAAGVSGATGHSLRVGSAVSLVRSGASLVDLQHVGRWRSPQMPAAYVRSELARQAAIARFRYGAL